MDWLSLVLKLSHVALAIGMVSGLLGRWILLSRAARTEEVERAYLLAEAAAPFERIVQVVSPIVVIVGLLTAWAQDYPWLGLTTGWMVLTVLLIIPILVAIPTIFLPRGKLFDAEMTAARAAGEVTPGLRAAWADPAVAIARRYELGAMAVIVALMVLKPF